MIINRSWAMASPETFKIKPIQKLIRKYVPDENNWFDPFSGDNSPAKTRNDINPVKNSQFHLDFYDFLVSLPNNTFDGALFDPPYSFRQITEVYEGFGLRKQYSLAADLISAKIKPSGICISFGWNTNGLGKSRGFEIVEILLVSHGASHNDTLVTVEKKTPAQG